MTQATHYDRRQATATLQIFDHVRMDLIPLLCETLLEPALAKTASYPSLNRGGWKSGEGILDYAPSTRSLRDTLEREYLHGKRPIGWAMVNRGGSSHPRHQHQGAIRTGVYYIAAGDPAVPTIFEMPDGEVVTVDPIPGRLAIFPGNLWHSVPKYDGTLPRITLAFDVRR